MIELTNIVSLEVAEPPEGGVTERDDKVQVTPLGYPETVRPTAELKPFNEVTVIVETPLYPLLMLSELGDTDREKSAADCALTMRPAVVE